MDKKIFLLADDDRDDTEMFMETIAGIDNSIICHCTADGREALQKLDELTEKPHLIFFGCEYACDEWLAMPESVESR